MNSMTTLVRSSSVLATLLFAIGACSSTPPPPSQPSPLLQRVTPSFDGKTLALTPIASAQGDGRPMVVKFFSSDCSRCKSTLPAMQRIYDDNKDILVVGVSEDESIEQARQLVNDLGVRFPVIYDGSGALARKYSVGEMPITFVIASNGNVSWVGGPEQTEDGVRAALSAAQQ